ncbi:YheC/YheD family protein [Bacillus sp. DJP31]|uniref:YheC/YheD family endospore coat-associated protein n=1 Tax=Bacillus sp. DJP31 TaxID=3409789 RepID=UPI003BB5B204
MINHVQLLLNHGLKKAAIQLQISTQIPYKKIMISTDIFDELNIFESVRYELCFTGDGLILGPYLGILMTSKLLKKPSKKSLNRYIEHYEKINGAIVAFSLSGINKSKKTVKGCLYDSSSKTWKEGEYPLPCSIFNKVSLSKSWRNYFDSIIGNRLFNSFWFNKWEMYQWLCHNPKVEHFLPETELYTEPDDLLPFLKGKNTSYIKPIYGSLGKGIFVLSDTENGFSLKYRSKNRNNRLHFQTWEETKKFLRSKLVEQEYVIQNAICLQQVGKSLIDFRMIVVKDQTGKWKDVGLLGRVGAENSVVCNTANGGSIELGELTIKQAFQMTDEEVTSFRDRMAQISIAAVSEIELLFHYGNIGVDLAVDQDKNIWVIELNNRDPHHYAAAKTGSEEIMYEAYLCNMLYAKRLSGFESDEPLNSVVRQVK